MKRKIQAEKEAKAIKEKLTLITNKIPELVAELFSIQSQYLEEHQDIDSKALKANTKQRLANGMRMVYRKALLACGVKEEDLGRDVSALMGSKEFQALSAQDKQQLLVHANKYQQAMSTLDSLITDDLVDEFVSNSKQTYDAKQDLMSHTTVLAVLATLLFIAAITTFILSFGILGAAVPVGAMIAATVVAAVAEVPVIMSLTNAESELAALESTNNMSDLLETKCGLLASQLQSTLSESVTQPETAKEESSVLKRLEQMQALKKHNSHAKKVSPEPESPHDKVLKPLETACKILSEIANPSKGMSR